MILISYDAPWLRPAKNFLDEVFRKQGKTSNNCTGMNDMSIIGLTLMPLFFDASDDCFYQYEIK